MFTGREYDAETGLYYYRARFYDPKVGRFLQRDPIGFGGGINLYTYCANRPTTLIDPMGLWTEKGIRKVWDRTETGRLINQELPTGTAEFKKYWKWPWDRRLAYYDPNTNTIYIPMHYTSEAAAPTAGHEAQHAIDWRKYGLPKDLNDLIEREVKAKNIGLDIYEELGKPWLFDYSRGEYLLRKENRSAYEEWVRAIYRQYYEKELKKPKNLKKQ